MHPDKIMLYMITSMFPTSAYKGESTAQSRAGAAHAARPLLSKDSASKGKSLGWLCHAAVGTAHLPVPCATLAWGSVMQAFPKRNTETALGSGVVLWTCCLQGLRY